MQKAIIHETFHFLGYDERYNRETKKPHSGFETDVLSNDITPAMQIHYVHFQDLAKFAIKKFNDQKTPVVTPVFVDHENFIDDTQQGQVPTSNTTNGNGGNKTNTD